MTVCNTDAYTLEYTRMPTTNRNMHSRAGEHRERDFCTNVERERDFCINVERERETYHVFHVVIVHVHGSSCAHTTQAWCGL